MNTSTTKLRVLIIEDEPMVAFFMEGLLQGVGHEVSMATRLPQALEEVRNGAPDVAILDVKLDGKASYPVARVLRQRGIPFVFATGYGAEGIDSEFADVPVLAKPFLEAELNAIVQHLRSAKDPVAAGPVTGSRSEHHH